MRNVAILYLLILTALIFFSCKTSEVSYNSPPKGYNYLFIGESVNPDTLSMDTLTPAPAAGYIPKSPLHFIPFSHKLDTMSGKLLEVDTTTKKIIHDFGFVRYKTPTLLLGKWNIVSDSVCIKDPNVDSICNKTTTTYNISPGTATLTFLPNDRFIFQLNNQKELGQFRIMKQIKIFLQYGFSKMGIPLSGESIIGLYRISDLKENSVTLIMSVILEKCCKKYRIIKLKK